MIGDCIQPGIVCRGYMVPASNFGRICAAYSTGHRQRQNETRLNAFGCQTQTRLRSPRPSNAGNS